LTKPNKIVIYTDGACLGNPGPGGYAAVLIFGEKIKEISKGYRLTTNNRMELMAVIAALECISNNKKWAVEIKTDSQLIANAFNQKWIDSWVAKNWKKSSKDKVINPELWQRLLELTKQFDVKFIWIKAHIGTEYNERCDTLAKEAAQQPKELLLVDEVYEAS